MTHESDDPVQAATTAVPDGPWRPQPSTQPTMRPRCSPSPTCVRSTAPAIPRSLSPTQNHGSGRGVSSLRCWGLRLGRPPSSRSSVGSSPRRREGSPWETPK